MHALVRARIPYLPIHVDDIERGRAGLKLLILPNVGGAVGRAGAAIRRFVQRGGSLFATGATGLYTEWGDPRPDFVLADLFGCHRLASSEAAPAARGGGTAAARLRRVRAATPTCGSCPELRARVDGPQSGDEPPVDGHASPGAARVRRNRYSAVRRHADRRCDVDADAIVPLTFVPPFPTYPPETSWMRQPKTDIPGLVLSEHGASRVAYMPADIDRRYAREHLPDHARLIANVVRWARGRHHPADRRRHRV